MVFLTALLAFAVIMLVLSTLVTSVVQAVHDLRKMRQRHFALYMTAIFDQVLWPKFGDKIAGPEHVLEDETHRAQYLERKRRQDILVSTGIFVIPFILFGVAIYFNKKWIDAYNLWFVVLFFMLLLVLAWDRIRNFLRHNRDHASNVSSARAECFDEYMQVMTGITGTVDGGQNHAERITVTDFAANLAETRIGDAIYEPKGDKARILVRDIVNKFDRLGRGASQSFERMSRKSSIIIAFLMALTLNVDAVAIVQNFLDDPDLSEQIIAIGNEIEEETRSAVGLPTTDTPVVEVNVKKLTDMGLPIGWSYFPFCEERESSDPRCVTLWEIRESYEQNEADLEARSLKDNLYYWIMYRLETEAFGRWFFGVLLGGIMIGLGGPFWYRFFHKLSGLANLLQNVTAGRSPSKKSEGRSSDEEVAKGSLNAHVYADAVEAFMETAKARAANRIS